MTFPLVYEEYHFRERTQRTQKWHNCKITATKRLKCSHMYLLTHDIRTATLAVVGEHIWTAATTDVVAFLDKWACLSPSLWVRCFSLLASKWLCFTKTSISPWCDARLGWFFVCEFLGMHINDRNTKFFVSINIILKIELTLFGPLSGLTEWKNQTFTARHNISRKTSTESSMSAVGASHDTPWLPWERLHCPLSSKRPGFWSKSAEMGALCVVL